GRRMKFSRAVFLANADRQKMVVDWQSVLGATILEGTEPSASDGTALVVTSVGDVFQLNASKIGRGGVELQPTTTLAVDDKTTTPIGAARMKDGRVAVWSAGESPKLWIVSNEAAPRETKLDLPLQTAPARLADGLVLPLPGRLRLAARNANAAPAQEWTAPVQAGAAPVWKGIAAVNDTSLVALDGTGRLMLVQLRSNPKPHLAEVSKWDAGQPVDVPLAIAGDRAIVATSNGRVFALDTQSLEPVGQFDLPRPAARSAVVIGSRVLIDSGREVLVCLDSATQMNKEESRPRGV
ncbi:MAG: PQQ-binding-like beta-propeller repeat protein, partial [Planctomycetota bacterium]|nr:PQQ-binding-like beta-propeller repeat protein [Planctomycetota bacterium]